MPSADAKPRIATAPCRHFKAFDKILAANALAGFHGLTETHKSGIVDGDNSQFLAIFGNLFCLTRQ